MKETKCRGQKGKCEGSKKRDENEIGQGHRKEDEMYAGN